MRYIFLFLLVFFLILLFYGFYTMLPDDTSDFIDEAVYNATGHRRVYLPEKIKKELNFLKFDKLKPDSINYIYYYGIDESNEKRLAVIITDKESKIFIDGTAQENIISESDMSRTYSVKIPQNVNIPLIVQTQTKPEAYIGKMERSINK